MTVKLAKFFTSSSNSNNSSSGTNNNPSPAVTMASAPPPLPPMNLPPTGRNYYQTAATTTNHQRHQQYNPYLQDDDDDDDNMSMYSTTASVMTTRDHPFNNSQRPLLAERKPQLLLNKKKFNNSQAHHHHQQLQQQRHQEQQPHKSYISPYVQQQKRDSAKGLHGFNDFDILSQQYNKHLQSPHIGYPYGSPPSPTVNSSDFVFDTPPPLPPPPALPPIPGRLNKSQHHQYTTTALGQQQPRYANVSGINNGNCGLYVVTATPTPTPNNTVTPTQHIAANDMNETEYYANYLRNNKLQQQPSHFEDDFCCRPEQSQSQCPPAMPRVNGGPFVFGIPHEDQMDCGLMSEGVGGRRRVFSDSTDTVITAATTIASTNTTTTTGGGSSSEDDITNDMYSRSRSMLSGQTTMQSTSDTSSSSRDINSNRKGAKSFRFLKRSKSKAKQTTQTNTKENLVPDIKADENKSKAPTIKCVLVGDAAVGKTNLILTYLENRFTTEHVPTASDIYNAEVMVNDSPVHLTLCDTAGQDTLDPLRELCYPDSDVFLLCFSVTKPETFHAIKTKWAPKFSTSKAALILVGTQADLRSNSNVLNKLQTNGEKPISYADAWDFASSIGAKYIETSSKTKDKVKEVFDTAIWEGLVPNALPPTPAPLWKRLFCLA